MKKLLFILTLLCSGAFAQVAQTGTPCTGTTSCTPTAGTGVLQLAYAGRDASTTAASTPAGWTSVGTSSINGTSTADSVVRLACRVTTSTNLASGTFTNAGRLVIVSYSGFLSGTTATCASTILGTPSFTATAINTTPTSVAFASVSNGDASSWDYGAIYAPAATAGMGTAPTGLTNITTTTGLGVHDTAAAVSSYSTANQSWTTGSRAISVVVEIKAAAAETPVSFPGPGTYTTSQTVTLTSATASATIKYCTDAPGSCTPSSGTTYSSGFSVASTSHVRAQATKTGLSPSAIMDDTYTISGGGGGANLAILLPLLGVGGGAGGSTNPTLVQNARNTACTGTTCAVTTNTLGAGHLLVLWSAAKYSGTGFADIETMAAPSGTTETWTHCPNQAVNNAFSSDAVLYALDCYYVLSAVGGDTSVTANWTVAGMTSTTTKIDAILAEYAYSGSLYYDTGNAAFVNAGCSSCTGPAGILSGSSDFVLQSMIAPGGSITSLTGYSNFFDTDASGNAFGASLAGAISQSSYAVPTWTLGGSTGTTYYSTIAFGSNSAPSNTGNMFIDMSGGTLAVAPTTVTMGSSTHTGWGTVGQDSSAMGSGTTYCTAPSGNNLPNTTVVNGVSYTGNGTKDFCGTTAGSGTAIGLYDVSMGDVNEPAKYAPMTVGYSFRSSCPANVECGASVRLVSNSGYAMAHASPLGDGHWCLEASNGGTCQEGGTPFNYAPNTWYRINVYMAGTTGTTDKMTVCTDGPAGSVLGTLTATSSAANDAVTAVEIGISGEEPTTAGYNYYFRNIVVGGTFSTTSCF